MNENPFNNLNSNPKKSENKSENKEKLDIKVELATEKDWEAIKDLTIKAITGEDNKMFGFNLEKELSKTEEDWKKDISGEDMFTIIARDDSKAIGMGRAWETKNKGLWRLSRGFLDKELRGNGIGKKIFASRLNEVIKRGGSRIIVSILPKNKTSIALAESFGFRRISDLKRMIQTRDIFNSIKWNSYSIKEITPEIIRKINEVLNER